VTGGEAQHPETGLPTRQHIEVQAAKALAQALRLDAPASILVMGFDRFDALRKEHGEVVAGQLQKKFASILAQKVRKEDSLGHYSDSELAVVSPRYPLPCLRGLCQPPAGSICGRQHCDTRATT
jgi:two-component system cell cycle response regulator